MRISRNLVIQGIFVLTVFLFIILQLQMSVTNMNKKSELISNLVSLLVFCKFYVFNCFKSVFVHLLRDYSSFIKKNQIYCCIFL